MTADGPLVLALEGGGSKTAAAALDLEGNVLAWGRGGSSLALYVGDERSLKSVEVALNAVAETVGPNAVEVAAGAMVGRGYASDPWAAVKERFPRARQVMLGEGDAALIGATLQPVGAVVLAGTGAFGRAVGEGGREGHVGGNGPLVGDEGSGHWVAVEGIRRALWARDGRGPSSSLVEGVCRHYDLPHLMHIIGRLYAEPKMDRHEIASLAPVVTEAAAEGDGPAGEVLNEAARLLADQAVAAINRVIEAGDGWSGAIPFGCNGGVLLGSPMLRELVADSVRDRGFDIDIRGPHLPPVGGVAIHALREAGVEITHELVATVCRSMPTALGARPAG